MIWMNEEIYIVSHGYGTRWIFFAKRYQMEVANWNTTGRMDRSSKEGFTEDTSL